MTNCRESAVPRTRLNYYCGGHRKSRHRRIKKASYERQLPEASYPVICTGGGSPGLAPRFCSDAPSLIEAWLLPGGGYRSRLQHHPFPGLVDSAVSAVGHRNPASGSSRIASSAYQNGPLGARFRGMAQQSSHPSYLLKASDLPSVSLAGLQNLTAAPRHSSPSLVPQACSHSNPSQKIKVDWLCTLLGPCFKAGSNGSPQASALKRRCRARRGACCRPRLKQRRLRSNKSGLSGEFTPDWGCIPKQPDFVSSASWCDRVERGGALTLSGAFPGNLGRSVAEGGFSDFNSSAKASIFKLGSSAGDPADLGVSVEDFGSSRALDEAVAIWRIEFTTCQGAPGIAPVLANRVRRALGQKAWGATCVQRLRWFQDSAIHQEAIVQSNEKLGGDEHNRGIGRRNQLNAAHEVMFQAFSGRSVSGAAGSVYKGQGRSQRADDFSLLEFVEDQQCNDLSPSAMKFQKITGPVGGVNFVEYISVSVDPEHLRASQTCYCLKLP
ncbi:hypothetical protein Bca52824_095729 [Brassica carinata]|uniref:Uncharacterized protein n=1 Tax=Brassica carinata TaxID=52824 RepID=A0A8X7TI02_BRACI|nr:hypothetical protein Bca52824_095729 [Brassica carinata]